MMPFAHTSRRLAVLAAGVGLCLAGCAGGGGLGSGAKTHALRVGMSPAEVRATLGEPGQTTLFRTEQVWRYSLHHYFVGWVPHDLVFVGDPARLVSWRMDEATYRRQLDATTAIIARPPAGAATTPAAATGNGRTASSKPSSRGCGPYAEDRIACALAELPR